MGAPLAQCFCEIIKNELKIVDESWLPDETATEEWLRRMAIFQDYYLEWSCKMENMEKMRVVIRRIFKVIFIESHNNVS